MKKLLIFHPALAPYRVDQFNALSQLFDLEVVFVFDNVWNHKFNQMELLSQLQCKYEFLLNGPFYKGRVFRFGMLGVIKGMKPDIILGYEYSLTTQYLILLKRLGLIHQKIGTTTDDSLDICNNVQTRSRYLARKNAVKRLDYLVVTSNQVSKFYQRKFKLKEQQIIVSPILQEPERLRDNSRMLENIAKEYAHQYHLEGKKVLLFIGRFIPEKGLPKFISTIQKILLEQENLVLVLVGDGEERHAIHAVVKEKGLEKKILLPGRYESLELYAWYLCASGFVLPSVYEPFGAVVNEALIFGVKVLCSAHAGVASLVDEDQGLLFDPLQEKDTVKKMNSFLSLINPVEDIDLTNKISLMSDHHEEFAKQWGKATYA